MRAFRLLASVLLPVAALASFGQGCVISQCDNGDPNCTEFEFATRYELAPETQSVAWVAGTPIQIISPNGTVTVTQGSGASVEATFTPFTLHEDNKEDAARKEMTENLTVSVAESGGKIVVRADKSGDANGGTGADITVRLPAGFDGAFEISQNNGSVDADLRGSTPASTKVVNDGAGDLAVHGAQGPLEVTASTGDVELSIAAWPTSNGSVFSDNGDITITVPAAADGTIELVTDYELTESGVPETWVATSNGYTMNTGAGATVNVTADFGDIALFVE